MRRLTAMITIIIICSIGFFIWWSEGSAARNPKDTSPHTFVISQQENVRDIGYALKKEGLIKDPIIFFLMVKKRGLDNKIQAGTFHLSASMTLSELTQALTHGVEDNRITIPEGLRAEEIAEIFQTHLSTYDKSWVSQLVALEGHLFPDTYIVPKNASLAVMTKLMLDNFEAKVASIQTKKNMLDKEKIVILASLIEREAQTPHDRALVASVLMNRINQGMPLQIDATVQYAIGYQKDTKSWWKETLTGIDLKYSSPYNTYLVNSLPPGPICNPGLSSLEAAWNPAVSDYLYYISDAKGVLHFARTNEEHNANIKKYGLP